MGESGAVLGRRAFVKRDILVAAEAIYKGESGGGACVSGRGNGGRAAD